MISKSTYTLTFIPFDKTLKEIYHYNNRRQAIEHFRCFYNQDSAELYQSISIVEYNRKTKEEKQIGIISFIENINGIQKAKDWRNWFIGRKTIFEVHDFDGDSITVGRITSVHSDHAIMEADGMHLWIDDDTIFMFR